MTETPPVRKGPAPPIGIDLGTTYSCAAYCENGKVTIVKNELGINTTPSYVAYPDPNQTNSTLGVIIGDSAKNQVDINPENVIYDVKRLIGRKFNDPIVQKDTELWPFKVIDEENTPRITVNGNDYHPEQISALVLGYLKKQAEVQIGGPVTDAVITVPAYFNDGQRQATKDAGSIAGLNVLRIINEPTAAAIAYNHQLQHKSQKLGQGQDPLRRKNVLIFDLGGGTFDLALLTMEGENIEVKAVDGDTHLGGQDIDNALVNYCLDEFKKKHNGIDLSKCQADAPNAVAEKFNMGKRLRRIKNECEMRKINLSNAKVVKISLEVIYQGEDLNVRIKRETFESICKPTFDKCIAIVDRILREANMAKEEVDDVVLVGGSSRIPKIQEMLQTYFGGKAPLQNIKQDEAVAYGAAVEAISSKAAAADGNNKQSQSSKSQTQSSSSASSSGSNNPPIKKVQFTDVIPLSIGIQVHVEKGDVEDFSIVLKKNTAVPHSTKKRFKTVYDNQKSVLIAIYEGQGLTVKENHLLGEFHLNNLPPGCKKGEPIDVQMDVNKEGILTVTAECPANKNSYNLTVTSLKGRLKREEVEQLRIQQMYEMKNTLANF